MTQDQERAYSKLKIMYTNVQHIGDYLFKLDGNNKKLLLDAASGDEINLANTEYVIGYDCGGTLWVVVTHAAEAKRKRKITEAFRADALKSPLKIEISKLLTAMVTRELDKETNLYYMLNMDRTLVLPTLFEEIIEVSLYPRSNGRILTGDNHKVIVKDQNKRYHLLDIANKRYTELEIPVITRAVWIDKRNSMIELEITRGIGKEIIWADGSKVSVRPYHTRWDMAAEFSGIFTLCNNSLKLQDQYFIDRLGKAQLMQKLYSRIIVDHNLNYYGLVANDIEVSNVPNTWWVLDKYYAPETKLLNTNILKASNIKLKEIKIR